MSKKETKKAPTAVPLKVGSASHRQPATEAAAAIPFNRSGTITARPASASKLTGAKPTIIAPVTAQPVVAGAIPELGLKEAIELVLKTPKPAELANKCVLLIDPTSRATTFLRHRDVNYMSAMDKDAMTAERIRLAIIGAILYKKPISIGTFFFFIYK
jgi:hypothetical protein